MAAASTSADRGRQIRDRLTGAAVELIAERGWAAVSTRILAERAGVAPGLVHYHFTSLPALLAEAAIGMMRTFVDALEPLLDAARTPDDALALLLGALDRYDGRDPTSRVFVETYLAASRDEQLRQAVGALLADFDRRLARWLGERGVSAPAETAAVLVAAIDGVLLHRALRPDLTAARVLPVLQGILTPARSDGGQRSDRAGVDR